MAILHLVRPNDYGGRYRSIKVFVDGQRAADFKPNERVSLVLVGGPHDVVGKMDWTRSRAASFDIAPPEEVTVELSLPYRAIIDTFLRPRRAIRARIIPEHPQLA